MLTVGKLARTDRDPWEQLFRGYMDFYGRDPAPEIYDRAWTSFQDDREMHAYGARLNGRLVGIAHFLFHPNTSAPDVCYLQDLFTRDTDRGKGVGRALIRAVTEAARERGCSRVYWSTHESNRIARRLYDDLAAYRGFIRYEIDLRTPDAETP